MKIVSLGCLALFSFILCAVQSVAATTPPPPLPKGAVLTWHNDNFRTGWQQQETILTTSTVGSLRFAHEIVFSDQIDAQPLVIPGFIGGHDIAFVADESNWVYQVDADTGAILKQVNLHRSVPKPLNCANNGVNVGVTSTPVIDWASQTLFVMAYVNINPVVYPVAPAYFLYALDLVTLQEKAPPLQVAASHTLTNGAAFTFNATNQRQRAGLVLANGNVYAAFTSFCDFNASASNPTGQPARGWLLGWNWNGTTLTALPTNQLNDRQPTGSYFLDTIWMSGAGPASDESGNLIFSTGNSGGATWTDTVPCPGTATGTVPTSVGCSNVQESVVKLKGDLTEITGLFSPNSNYGSFSPNTNQLDASDEDLGSGGVLLVPQLGSSLLAATAGKDGRLFLFDRSGTGLNFLQLRQGSGCWCAPSYFAGPEAGYGRIVTSQGSAIQTFKVPSTSLSPDGTSSTISTGQDHGFFTTVSCNGDGAFGNCTNTPIIWAVSRPTSSTSGISLYAFSGIAAGGSYPLLYGPAKVGNWLNIGGNANIVPTVSNGQVYVASYRFLMILDLKQGAPAAAPPSAQAQVTASAEATAPTEAAVPAEAAAPTEAAASPTSGFAISGTLQAVNGSTLTFTNRNGKERLIDASKAIANGHMAPALTPGEAYTAVGSSFTSASALQADAISRAKCRQHDDGGRDRTDTQPACTGDQWPLDRDPGQ